MRAGIDIPLDIESVGALGVDYYQANFECVVADEEFTLLEESLYSTFTDCMLSCDKDVHDAALVDYRYLFFLVQHGHLSLIRGRAARIGAQIRCGAAANRILDPSWEEMSSFEGLFGQTSSSVTHELKKYFRRHRDTWLNNTGNAVSTIGNLAFSDVSSLWLGVPGLEVSLWANNYEGFRHFLDICADDLAVNKGLVDHKFLKRAEEQYVGPLQRSYEDCLNALGAIMISNKPFLTCLSRLNHAWMASKSIDRDFSTGKYKTTKEIFAIGNGNPCRKLISLVGRRNGVEINLFSHGYDQCLFPFTNMFRARYGGATRFLIPSTKIKKSYQKYFGNDPFLENLPTHFTEVRDNKFHGYLKRKWNGTERPIQNGAMVIGWPFNANRYPCAAGCYWYSQLDLQYRVAKLLKSFGLRVTYKAHPDRLEEGKRIIGDIVDEVNCQRLEDMATTPEFYIFTSPISQTLCFAAYSNRPIVLLESPGFNWNLEGKKRLQERCRLIQTRLGTNGQVVFQEDELYQAVTEAYPTNDNFIEEYR